MQMPKVSGLSGAVAVVALGLCVVSLDSWLPAMARALGGAAAATAVLTDDAAFQAAAPDKAQVFRQDYLLSSFGDEAGEKEGAVQHAADGARIASAVQIGDKVDLRVFEAASGGSADQAESAVFERLDLSGVFEVDETGVIAVPALGRVQAAGQTLSDLESALHQRMSDLLGQAMMVTATYAARPPVLVRGAVQSPGSYVYAPALTVASVLAQAGADQRGAGVAAQQAMFKARYQELSLQQAGLTLELSGLESQLQSDETLQLTEVQRRDIKGRLGEARLAGEQAVLQAALQAEQAHLAQDKAELADLDSSIVSAGTRLSAAQTQREVFVQREASLTARLDGDCNERCREGRPVLLAQRDVAVSRLMDLELLVLEKAAELERLTHAKASRQSGATLGAAERRRDTTIRIRDIMAERDVLDAQIASIEIQYGGAVDDGQISRIMVLRKAQSGQQLLEASADMRLLPGDIVTVEGMTTNITLKDRPAIDLVQASQ